jgi:hypothetical protein
MTTRKVRRQNYQQVEVGVLAIEQILRQNTIPVPRLKEEQSMLWLKPSCEVKFTLISCQILPAKSIVTNKKNHKVVGYCLL